MSRKTTLIQTAGIATLFMSIAGCGGNDNGSPAVTAQQACTSLQGKTISAGAVVSAVAVAASGVVPTYCKVSAHIEPHRFGGRAFLAVAQAHEEGDFNR